MQQAEAAAAKEQADVEAAAAAGQQAHQRLEESRAQELNTAKAVVAAQTSPGIESPEKEQLPPLKNVRSNAGGKTDFHRGEVTSGKGPPSKSRASFKVNSAADPRGQPRSD